MSKGKTVVGPGLVVAWHFLNVDSASSVLLEASDGSGDDQEPEPEIALIGGHAEDEIMPGMRKMLDGTLTGPNGALYWSDGGKPRPMELGEVREAILSVDDGHGHPDPQNYVTVNADAIEAPFRREGAIVVGEDDQENPVLMRVQKLEINLGGHSHCKECEKRPKAQRCKLHAVIDSNTPFAGLAIRCRVRVVGIRSAHADETALGQAIPEEFGMEMIEHEPFIAPGGLQHD